MARVCGRCGRPVDQHPRFREDDGTPTMRKGKGTVRLCPLDVDAGQPIPTARFDPRATTGDIRTARRARKADGRRDRTDKLREQMERMADDD